VIEKQQIAFASPICYIIYLKAKLSSVAGPVACTPTLAFARKRGGNAGTGNAKVVVFKE